MAKETNNTNRRNVYALMVAINDYPIDRHKLKGCVNDLKAFKGYLERRFENHSDFNLDFYHLDIGGEKYLLTDKHATRQNIIDAFDYFQQARDGDICLFFFTGHGSRAASPPEFWHIDTDKMSESLVCWDSRIKGGRDLRDKELSYLISKATDGKDVHFLAIFDCCHAGSNTKGVGDEITPRMAEENKTPTFLKDLEGHASYTPEKIDGQARFTPPRGRHIQLAAAKSNETAKEMRIGAHRRGVFTYHLIELLERTGGQLTYPELTHLLGVRIANKVKDQTPLYDAVLDADPEQLFLGGALPKQEPFFRVSHGKEGWEMNAGLIQGIPRQGGEIRLEDGTTATIIQVNPNNALLLDLPGKNKEEVFKAFIHKMPKEKAALAIAPESEPDGAKILRRVYPSYVDAPFSIVDPHEDHQYLILAREGSYRLVTPDNPRPLFRRVPGYTEEKADIFLRDVVTVARWRTLLDLANPTSTITDDDFKIELFRTKVAGKLDNSDPVEPVDWRRINDFHYDFIDGKWQEQGFRLRLTNTGHKTLYVSGLYLSFDYSVTNKFLRRHELGPGESVEMTEEYKNKLYTIMPCKLGKKYQDAGLTEIRDYVKLFITTDPGLKTDGYNQEGLPMDVPTTQSKDAGRGGDDEQPEVPDWTTREIGLNIIRPLEETEINKEKPAKLFKAKVTAPTGFRAKASLGAVSESERAIGDDFPSPDQLWGHQEITEPYLFSEGNSSAPGLSVLELRDIEGGDQVTADNPLLLQVDEPMAADEFIVPMGYDPETGQFYPLGLSDENGEIRIETLPDETPSGTRSLSGSVKIFFQKVVLSKLGIEYKHPQIAVPEFQDDGEEFEYNTDLAAVRSRVESAHKVVLFMHGIIGDTLEMAKSAKRISNGNGGCLFDEVDLVLTFDYENLKTGIDQTARDLKARLEEVGLGAGHGKELTIVAHSMGGLVSRWFIEKEGGNEIVSHLVQVGTPNLGSPWSDVYELSSVLLARAVNGAAFLQPYLAPLSLLGKLTQHLFVTLSQMDPDGSDFLKKLNDGADPGIPYTILAGNTQLIPLPEEEMTKAQNLLKKLVARFKNRGHYDALDMLLFKQANDIAVSVDSILNIPGKESRAHPPKEFTVGCDHISYFADPAGLEGLQKALF